MPILEKSNSRSIKSRNKKRLSMKCHSHKHHPKKEVEFILSKLRAVGSRITSQRKFLVQAIIKSGGPFSAEELHSKVKSSGIDLVTVYRSLTAFTDLKILTTVDFHDGVQRYEYICSEEGDHHHHIICKQCRDVKPISSCIVEKQEKMIKKMGYTDISHKLEFFGLCEKCTV